MGLGTPDAAALTARIVRGWANDVAVAPKEEQDADVVLPIDLENACGKAFPSTCLEAARTACPQLASDLCGARGVLRHKVLAATRRRLDCGQHDKGRMARFAGHASYVRAWTWPHREITRIGLQDDVTFTGSAAALNRSWGTVEGVLADAGHRLRSFKCGVWAPEFEQFEDAELPMEVPNLCLKIPRKRHGMSLLGSAANAQHCMHVSLGKPAEVPTETTERVEKARSHDSA